MYWDFIGLVENGMFFCSIMIVRTSKGRQQNGIFSFFATLSSRANVR